LKENSEKTAAARFTEKFLNKKTRGDNILSPLGSAARVVGVFQRGGSELRDPFRSLLTVFFDMGLSALPHEKAMILPSPTIIVTEAIHLKLGAFCL
jgi:hypothetical protein